MAEFDVFLAHNSLDKREVQFIAALLRQRGLEPWIDDEQIPPGRPFQEEIQQAIPLVKSAAIFIGVRGLGRWQILELRSLINQCVKRNIPVIPVLLPGVEEFPEQLVFLEEYRWVSFSQTIDEEGALYLLEWGITQIKPKPQPTNTSTPKTTKTPEPPPTDDLSSEKGINYSKLRDLLKAGEWKQADRETYLVMFQAVGKKQGSLFSLEELLNFPCTDLRTIDRLWVKYSNGRFGFSVQKRIYLEVGGKADGNYNQEAWKKFGDRVGWRMEESWIYYPDVTLSTSAPDGHLPWDTYDVGTLDFGGVFLFSRIQTCKL